MALIKTFRNIKLVLFLVAMMASTFAYAGKKSCISVLTQASNNLNLHNDLGYDLEKGMSRAQQKYLAGMSQIHIGGLSPFIDYNLDFIKSGDQLPKQLLLLSLTETNLKVLLDIANAAAEYESPKMLKPYMSETDESIEFPYLKTEKLTDKINKTFSKAKILNTKLTQKFGFDVAAYVAELHSLRRDILTTYSGASGYTRSADRPYSFEKLIILAKKDSRLLTSDLLKVLQTELKKDKSSDPSKNLLGEIEKVLTKRSKNQKP